MEKKKVALYARVSLDEAIKDATGKKQFQDPENQLEQLRKWAESQDWEVVAEYVDRASGADHNRPNFIRMMNDAMLLKFNYVLVWKLDRFSREGISHTLAYIKKLQSRNRGLKSMTESWVDITEDNPLTELILAIFAWVAAEERRKISERTKVGIQRRKNLGVWKGGRPKKIATPEQTELIKQMLSEGKGLTKIMRKLKVGRSAIREIKSEIKGSPILNEEMPCA